MGKKGKKSAAKPSHAEINMCVRTEEGGRIVEAYIHPEHGKGKGMMTDMARTLSPKVYEYIGNIERILHEVIQEIPEEVFWSDDYPRAELAYFQDNFTDHLITRVDYLVSFSRKCDEDMSFDNQRKWQGLYLGLEQDRPHGNETEASERVADH
jgi:hypothetical protein